MNKYSGILQLVLVSCIIGASTQFILSTQAASAYHVTLSTSNFSLQTISVSADDLSNPGHVTFHLQNGSPFWYSIGVQSTPTGMVLTPANANDLVTTTFLSSTPLLPPVGVLPFDQSNGAFASETLHIALAFSGPDQQVQLTLNPFDTHAAILDALTLLLQLLGQKHGLSQIGLLAPNGLQTLFNAVSTMKDFNSLANDYMQLLQNASNTTTNDTNTGSSLVLAYACARDIVALLTDQSEQLLLSSVLWNATGKAIPRTALLSTIASFSNAQFSLGIEGFLADEAQVMGASLFQVGSPMVLLQTLSTVPVAQSPAPGGSVTPVPSVSPVVTASPTPDPTISATGTP